jgi:hypothetical protein
MSGWTWCERRLDRAVSTRAAGAAMYGVAN